MKRYLATVRQAIAEGPTDSLHIILFANSSANRGVETKDGLEMNLRNMHVQTVRIITEAVQIELASARNESALELNQADCTS